MKQFEYTKFLIASVSNMISELNNCGEQGWQLVGFQGSYILLMREISNAKENNNELTLEQKPERELMDNGEFRNLKI